MATFEYEVLREPGDSIRGEIDAADARAATNLLIRRGYHVLRLEDVGESRSRLFGMGRVRHRAIVQFTRDAASLLKAGLSLDHALRTLRERYTDPAWRMILGAMRTRLEEGGTFSQCLAAHNDAFNSVYVNLVRAGEESGKLVEVLQRLAKLGERREELRRRVRLALVYPAVLSALGVITVVVMMTFVVPMFTQVFRESNQALPWPTAVLVLITGAFSGYWWIVLPAIAVAVLAFVRVARTENGRRAFDHWILRMPVLGPFVAKSQIAAFTTTMSTLLESGIPIVRALKVTGESQDNAAFRDAIQFAANTVRDGEALSTAITSDPLFPNTLSAIIAVGEQSGTLAETLGQLAHDYDEEVERDLKVVMTLIEPAMIVILGAIIGFIVIAMLLPIFSLGDTLSL